MALTRRAEQIQKTTHRLLQLAQVSGPPVPVEQIAQLRGTSVRYVSFEDELSGILFREDGQVVIGVNKIHSKRRQAFTIAHELGHVELHSRNDLHIDRNFRVLLHGEEAGAAIDQSEIEANAFATELLIPGDALERDLKGHLIDYEDDELIRSLADRYQVSLQVMIFRLAGLGLINL